MDQLSLPIEKPAKQHESGIYDGKISMGMSFLTVDYRYPRSPRPSYELNVWNEEGQITHKLEANLDLHTLRVYVRGQHVYMDGRVGLINRANRIWNCAKCHWLIEPWELKCWIAEIGESYCLRHVEPAESIHDYILRTQ